MSLSDRDKEVIWHPYTPFCNAEVIPVVGALAETIYCEDGSELIDLISSWWVNIHGHCHPVIQKRITDQLTKIDHVIFAGFTHEAAVLLAEGLLRHLPSGQKRIFYSDNGSTAVEVAIKIAIQHWSNKRRPRDKILVLEGGYHGDTVGAMSVSERGIFNQKFNSLMFTVEKLEIHSITEDNLLSKAQELAESNQLAAFIYEPLIQGAGGMNCYSANLLEQLLSIFKKHKVICIADEVMTGFGRTGRWFASDYLKTDPDIVCLSKGITGGVFPLGVTSCSAEIVEPFLDSASDATFFHGHSYTANALACAAACASLELLEKASVWEQIERIQQLHQGAKLRFSKYPNAKNVRSLGTILALNLSTKDSNYLNPIAPKLYKFFIKRGLLIRPLGNVVYLMPPYCISMENLNRAYDAIEEALEEF
jgi:adenosylmethionine---8-amino-7-oxononanoate aminotransferase